MSELKENDNNDNSLNVLNNIRLILMLTFLFCNVHQIVPYQVGCK